MAFQESYSGIAHTNNVWSLQGFDKEEPKVTKAKTFYNASKDAPTRFQVFRNPDKTTDTKVDAGNPCQPAHPSRVMIVGKPGCGKRSLMYNILQNYPEDFAFDTITEVHVDAHSDEHKIFMDPDDGFDYICYQWNDNTDLGGQPWMHIGLPPLTRFQGKRADGTPNRNLLIMDEPPAIWSTKMMRGVSYFFNYVSTHYSTTVFLITQDYCSVPRPIRDASTHVVVYPVVNRNNMNTIANRCGADMLMHYLRLYCKDKHQSIMVDVTGDGPRYRRNVYEAIENNELQNELEIYDPEKSDSEDEKGSKKKRKKEKSPAKIAEEEEERERLEDQAAMHMGAAVAAGDVSHFDARSAFF